VQQFYRNTAGLVSLVAATVGIDLASKAAAIAALTRSPGMIDVTSFFSLRLGFNTGISFGLFQSTFAASPWLLIVLQLGVVAGLLWMAIVSQSRREVAALGLIAGGAIGNIVDRAQDGAVTDFLDFYWRGWHWPTFNIADVAICMGAALIVLSAVSPLGAAAPKSHDG
jgi:signal peptidase II